MRGAHFLPTNNTDKPSLALAHLLGTTRLSFIWSAGLELSINVLEVNLQLGSDHSVHSFTDKTVATIGNRLPNVLCESTYLNEIN